MCKVIVTAVLLGLFFHKVTRLEDVGALVEDNLFERDILIATKILGASPNITERTQAVKDLGHLSWSGGPSSATFAGNQLVNLLGVLNDSNEPTALKMFTIQAISEICLANKDNQDKARCPQCAGSAGSTLVYAKCYGILQKLTELLSTTEPELSALRRSSAACLLTLACENLENQKALLCTDRLQEYLTSVSVEDWSAWDENEAAQLITFLGLDHTGEPRSRLAKIRAHGTSNEGKTE